MHPPCEYAALHRHEGGTVRPVATPGAAPPRYHARYGAAAPRRRGALATSGRVCEQACIWTRACAGVLSTRLIYTGSADAGPSHFQVSNENKDNIAAKLLQARFMSDM